MPQVNEVYHNPRYYELAFSFRDIPAEVDVCEALIKQYSRIPVSQVLELGCGPAPYLEELARRGYTYVGLTKPPHAGLCPKEGGPDWDVGQISHRQHDRFSAR